MPSDLTLRVKALESLLVEKGLVDPAALDRVAISACGTAYFAGIVGKYWLERYARLPVEIDFIAVSSYGSSTRTSGVVRLVKDLDVDLPHTLLSGKSADLGGERAVA